jgi:hypothetical protein
MKSAITMIILASLLLAGCATQTRPITPDAVCGNSVCEAKEAATGSCPSDCKAEEKEYETKTQGEIAEVKDSDGCVGEGGTIPVIPNPPECCAGLTLIDRKESSILGISGICTAKCGNGVCDSETESPNNCPADCEAMLDSMPVCDGAGTSKEGWYQNDKILMYARCAGCTAECRNKGTNSEGWYNTCDNKQIKRMCN